MDSPPAVAFYGEGVLVTGTSNEASDRMDGFEAEGQNPVCVALSCQEVTLSWTCHEGSRVSILRDGETFREGLAHVGLLKVTDSGTASYTRRRWLVGAEPDQYSDRTVEVLRYPSMSLVLYGKRLWTGGRGEFGASISCPAGDEGVTVRVRSSDPETVPDFEIRIPPGAVWGQVQVPLGQRGGVAKITGSAHGYAQDTVILSMDQS